jgi:hypothetical protein
MNNKDIEREYMKKISIMIVLEQLRLRGENAILADRLARYDIFIKDKGLKIKVKFTKPKQRSKCIDKRWEFNKLIHSSRLYPINIFDYYLLVGFGDNGNIERLWKISAGDNIIYRKNLIFIPLNDVNEEFNQYELEILNEGNKGLKWID